LAKSNVISRKYLIPLRSEFSKIKATGKMVTTSLFSLTIAKNNFAYPRFAFIISKKVDNRSVIRHRIKRCLAQAVKDLYLPANDYVFFAKKTAVNKTIEELKNEITNVIHN